ncbi:MAG: winged helix DNA-binding domain-containing protein [Defluviitaleaceae bacterium]|nr:winged helix DNA-binding domain-containing protein [Defluviitaleaceae bacterium]
MDKTTEQILRRRMHGLYLSRQCGDITRLSREILGMHCWFHRNVAFSALIRGADLYGWKNALTKTWLYRGTLHGVAFEELPKLLALHSDRDDSAFWWLGVGEEQLRDIADRVVSLMEDGVYSRAEMRRIFARDYDDQAIGRLFSPWGGIFVYLARLGKVAFRDMTSRDFDLISAEPAQTPEEVLPALLHRFFAAYGPATIADAAWFFGFWKDDKKKLAGQNLEGLSRLEYNKNVYYYADDGADMGDIPRLTLLSGFDPLIVSYVERGAVLPPEYKSAVIMKSGICLPTIAVDGQVAGLWNIKKGEAAVEFFAEQPKGIKDAAFEMADDIRRRTAGML